MGKSVREIYQELTQYNENLKQDRCENRKIGDDDSGGGDSKHVHNDYYTRCYLKYITYVNTFCHNYDPMG